MGPRSSARPRPCGAHATIELQRRLMAWTFVHIEPAPVAASRQNSLVPVRLRVGWSLRLALRPTISARERFYADSRSARRGNAPLRQTGSTAGPALYLCGAGPVSVVRPPRTAFRRAVGAAERRTFNAPERPERGPKAGQPRPQPGRGELRARGRRAPGPARVATPPPAVNPLGSLGVGTSSLDSRLRPA